ncbi:MAG: DapH/DapD/GlmU-related protein [Gammaproteobacteria bacterium]
MSKAPQNAYGFGLASENSKGEIIEVFYPAPVIDAAPELLAILLDAAGLKAGGSGFLPLDANAVDKLHHALNQNGFARCDGELQALEQGSQPIVLCVLGGNSPPASVAECFLKLHLLSHRLALPHSLNLEGLFGVLHNLAWTNEGAISLSDLPDRQLQARLRGELLEVMSVDKFPKMTNYVVPSGVRIAHTARVRLGAYVGEGTTVMHEGFVNFNAGTLGSAMIEGRISAGVVVGENSDLGGGSSTMGTLSGGGSQIVSVGRNCLIGANGGIGCSLPDGCIVEAGLYITAGTKVNLLDENGELIKTCKARELGDINNRLYRRNSLTGAVECVPTRASVSLNQELHSHN